MVYPVGVCGRLVMSECLQQVVARERRLDHLDDAIAELVSSPVWALAVARLRAICGVVTVTAFSVAVEMVTSPASRRPLRSCPTSILCRPRAPRAGSSCAAPSPGRTSPYLDAARRGGVVPRPQMELAAADRDRGSPGHRLGGGGDSGRSELRLHSESERFEGAACAPRSQRRHCVRARRLRLVSRSLQDQTNADPPGGLVPVAGDGENRERGMLRRRATRDARRRVPCVG